MSALAGLDNNTTFDPRPYGRGYLMSRLRRCNSQNLN